MNSFSRSFLFLIFVGGCASTPGPREEPKDLSQIRNYFGMHGLSPIKFSGKLLIGEVTLYESRQSLLSLSGQFAMTSDRRFRLEVANPLGQTALLALSNGKELWVINPQKHTCERTSMDSGQIAIPSLKMNVPSTVILSLVSGYPYHIAKPAEDEWSWKFHDEKTPEIQWIWGQTTYLFEDARSDEPQSLYYLENGQGFKQEIISWDDVEGVEYPDKWRLKTTWQQDHNSLVWKWDRISLKDANQYPQLFDAPQVAYCPR